MKSHYWNEDPKHHTGVKIRPGSWSNVDGMRFFKCSHCNSYVYSESPIIDGRRLYYEDVRNAGIDPDCEIQAVANVLES